VTTATNNAIRVEILDGGNKFELFMQLLNIGLKDDNGKTLNRPNFRVKARLEGLRGSLSASDDHLWITGISAEDGSGNSWIIEGDYPSTVPNSNGMTRQGGSFKGLYNTRTRHGFIEVTAGHLVPRGAGFVALFQSSIPAPLVLPLSHLLSSHP